MIVWRITKCFSLSRQISEESTVIISNHLVDNRQVGTRCLKQYQPSFALTTRTSADLRHHHESMFISTEIGIIQHIIGIKDAYNTYFIKVKSFADHLCTNKQVCSPCREIGNKTFISITCSCRIKIHTSDMGLGESLHDQIFNLLCTISSTFQILTATVRTYVWNAICISAIMACQLIHTFMQSKTYITVGTMRHPSTHITFYHWCKASSILKENSLFTFFQSFTYSSQKLW